MKKATHNQDHQLEDMMNQRDLKKLQRLNFKISYPIEINVWQKCKIKKVINDKINKITLIFRRNERTNSCFIDENINKRRS